MNRNETIDKDWFFSLEDRDDVLDVLYDFSSWKKVTLPHDWSTEFPYNKDADCGRRGAYVRTGVGYYKKIVYGSKEMLNQYVAIEFDGVYMNSQVYINGVLLGKRPYGYISFAYDISNHLVEGVNIITVKVDCSKQESSRWYNGCGIYRHVRLRVTDPIHVERNGTYITTEVKDDSARVSVEVTIVNGYKEDKKVIVSNNIYCQNQGLVGGASQEIIAPSGQSVSHVMIKLTNPKLWSTKMETREDGTQKPAHLYQCKTELIHNSKYIDEYTSSFGVRKLEFIPNKGFFLNGESLKFKGVCIHHDSGVVGAAVPDKINRKRLQLLKNMGCNAVRTAHNPFSSVFYDLCDELGLMVMDEIFDGWETKKATHDYGEHFLEWHEKDLNEWVRRDRNHPSVVMWSIGNEVTKMTVETAEELMNSIKALDKSRPVTCGVNGVSQGSEDNRAILDIAGYNDGGGACFLYDRDHETRPNQLMIATEAPHTSQTRGFYRTQTWWRDKNQPRIEIDNLTEEEIFFDGDLAYRSSYDNAGVRVCIRDSWKLSEDRDYLLGEFRWSGFDYYGESFGWPARWSDSGIIGMDNCPKDAYYLYQSMWSDKPMIHMLPHWTHPTLETGSIIPVWGYTNCEEAELFLNGISLGRKSAQHVKHIQWDVPYQPGNIDIVGYINGGRVAADAYQTAGLPCRLNASLDCDGLVFDGVDTGQVDVLIKDDKGVTVPYGDNMLFFSSDECITIAGTENGNCVDTTPLASKSRKAFNSLCMAVIRGEEIVDEQIRGKEAQREGNSKQEIQFDKESKIEKNSKTEKNSKLDKESKVEKNVYIGSILGESIFKEETTLSFDLCQLRISQNTWEQEHPLQKGDSDYTYTLRLNGVAGSLPRVINKTTQVEVSVFKKGALLMDMAALFIKGEREKVIDLSHGNKVLNLDKPAGPFAKEVAGLWTGFKSTYDFREDGTLVRILNKNQEQAIGHWWYDFPIDPFESQEYAGQGEIWFDSGERCGFSLKSQACEEAVMDNGLKAIGTAYNFPKEILFQRLNS